MRIAVYNPQGVRPAINSRLLGQMQAQTAENCVFESADCRPLNEPKLSVSLQADTKAVFRLGGAWLEFDNEASVMPSPVEADDDRYYYTLETGGGKKADDDTESPLDLGVARPSTGPTLTLEGTAGDNIERSSTYVYTRVTDWGEESAPSQPSGEVDVYEGQYVTFSDLTDGEESDPHVTHYRLYRAVGGETSDVWLLVPYQTTAGEIQYDTDNNIKYDIPKDSVSEAEDGLSDDALNVTMETLEWHTPPADLHHLTYIANGLIAGLSGREVCFAVSWVPYAWPTAYRYTLDADGVGLGHINGIPVAFTSQSVYLFDGSSPDSFYQRRLSDTQGCESASSITSAPDGVYFASKDGLCKATTAGVEVLTLGIWTRDQWSDYALSDLVGFYFKQAYYGFFKSDNSGFILPLTVTTDAGLSVTEIALDEDYTIINGYLLPSNDKLFLILDDGESRGLFEFDAGEDPMQMTWKSKVFKTPYTVFSAFRLDGASGTSTVKIYDDSGSLILNKELSHNTAVRLPASLPPPEISVEIIGTTRWWSWVVAQGMEELGSGL